MDAQTLCKVVPFGIYQVLDLFPQFYTENVVPADRPNVESPAADLARVHHL